MIIASKIFLNELDALSKKRKEEIRALPDSVTIAGTTYYVSTDGNDGNDGLSPDTSWKTLNKVSDAELMSGDGVLFRRGDLFRGGFTAKAGVTYAAYGEGEKPRFYSGAKDLAAPELWELYDADHNIWKMRDLILDCGTLVFNHGEAHSRKLIPSFRDMKFVCRDDESRDFDMAFEMTLDLDIFCSFTAKLTEEPSKGESFPIPDVYGDCRGELYLRCDRGNPGEVFDSIEALERMTCIRVKGDNVTINNLCIKYVGAHGIGGGGKCLKGLHVSGCELGWIGGVIQHYYGTDPNYPQGRRGSVTRFGNGIEIYGGCDDYAVTDCYIYQVYDAGITHQVTTRGTVYGMKNIRYLNNLIEYCVYSIEYFLEKLEIGNESLISDCLMEGNILRFSGYGWGQQRHNFFTPAHIKGWSYDNTASDFRICNNIFDRAAYRMVHLVAHDAESCPEMQGNTYVQKLGLPLGQYGAMAEGEPLNMVFDERTDERIASVMKEKDAKVYYFE